MRFLTYNDLKARRIVGSRTDLHRKRQDPRFPKPVQDGQILKWFEDEIDAYAASLPRVDKRRQIGVRENLARQEEAVTA